MRIALLLLSAAYLNGGRFVDAGETVSIGEAPTEITEERARDIEAGRRGEFVEVNSADGGDDGDDAAGDDGLDRKTVAELRAIGQDEEIDLGGATKKPEIVAAIRAERERRLEAHG